MNGIKKIIVSLFSFVFLSALSPLAVLAAPPQLKAPSDLTATAVSSSQINLSWADNSKKETGFRVEQSIDGNYFTEIASVGKNITSYSDTGLSENTTYYYRVRAYRVKDQRTRFSDYSNTASDTTFSLPSPPTAPTNLYASPGMVIASTTLVWLDWTDNSSDETYFDVESSTDGVNFSSVGSTLSNDNDFIDVVPNNDTYYYRVQACNGSGCSAYSNVEMIVIP